MVEVFKTDVTNEHEAQQLVRMLTAFFPDYEINFDLEDCDHVLRIKSTHTIELVRVIPLLSLAGVTVQLLN